MSSYVMHKAHSSPEGCRMVVVKEIREDLKMYEIPHRDNGREICRSIVGLSHGGKQSFQFCVNK